MIIVSFFVSWQWYLLADYWTCFTSMDSHEQHVKLLVSREQRMIHSPSVLMISSSCYIFPDLLADFDYTCPYSLCHIFLLYLFFHSSMVAHDHLGLSTPRRVLGRFSYPETPNPSKDRAISTWIPCFFVQSCLTQVHDTSIPILHTPLLHNSFSPIFLQA